MLLFQMAEIDCSAHANVSRWLGQCYERPALARARVAGEG